MENEIKSKLSFINYRVKEVTLIQNDNFHNEGKAINVNFKLKHEKEISNDKMKIKLVVTIFEDPERNNYPFYMKVALDGNFEIEGDSIETFEINGIALLYPYIRAIVSTYTANSNIPTVILPPINVANYYREYKKEQEN